MSHRLSEVVGVLAFAAAMLWLVALVSYNPADPVWFFHTGTQPPVNFAGRVGAFLAELGYQLVGFGAFLLPVGLAVAGWHYFWCRTLDAGATKIAGGLVLVLGASALFSRACGAVEMNGAGVPAGGVVGDWLAQGLAEYLNNTGSVILLLTALFLGTIMATQLSLGQLASAGAGHLTARWVRLVDRLGAWRDERRRAEERRKVVQKHRDRGVAAEDAERAEREAVARRRLVRRERRARAAEDAPDPVPAQPEAAGHATDVRAQLPFPELEGKAPAERRRDGFTLPPAALLDAPRTERKIDERDLMDAARLLEDKCREFSVEGSVVQIHPGPVVTTYEFKPDAGVKYAKITSLAEDLCLAMRAESVLIDRIPGRSTVGIQIPNAEREQISLRELLECDKARRSSSKLTLALGKTIHGEPYVTDLTAMPHLLIAGATGTGKSVCLNALLTSILYRSTPDEVRLILIDPKRLELGMYHDLPHLLTPVVVEPKLAANALRWAVKEMEDRYKRLASEGVRNIDQYNRNVLALRAEHARRDTGPDELPSPLPFLVVVIDELADLMMVASHEVEESIARLAQMARAVGIHLILATQRPSVDVITGLIKANFPARIAFRVSSKVDSRTILDGNGAEQLLGKGDLLYLPPASSRIIRLHGPYISEQETARLVSFLRKQGEPDYDETITDEERAASALEFEKDDLYDEAARLVVESGQASTSYLQRRLRIGYSRASRLMDVMEAEGLVSTVSSGKPREVLVAKDYFAVVDGQLR